MDSSSRLSAYRKLIQEIKSVVKEKNLSRSDNSLIKGLLKVLQFDCEFKILSECYSNSEEFNKVVPDVETIYENYKRELDVLEEKNRNNQFAGMDSFRYQRLSKATNRLDNILKMVKTREFNHYMNAIVVSLNESDQIIEVCGTILSEGVQDFSRLFGRSAVKSNEDGHMTVDGDYVDTIYTLLSHSDTIKLAEQYLRSYRLLHLDELKANRDVNNRFRWYLSIIQDNLEVFREYMKLIQYSSKKSHEKLSICEAKIGTLELEAHETRNILRRNSIQQEILRLKETIDTINNNLERVLELESKIESLGCGGLIEALDTTMRDSENTPEAKVVQILRPLSKNSFNMNNLIESVSAGIRKEDEEIEAMKKSIAITDEIYQKVIEHIHVGMSEYEISALVQYYSIASGAQQMSFDTIVATGERTALPHGRPTSRKVKAHEPIMIDFGIQYQNYQSDMTRMCFIGEPDPKIKEIYDVVLKAQLAGLSAIKAGAKGKDVDKAARDVIEAAGYGEYFNHGLGHGLGIGEDGEGPTLNSKSETVLQEHMMMSCEPGVYVPGVGGVRIEDDVVIIDGVGVPLNKTTKDYIILEDK